MYYNSKLDRCLLLSPKFVYDVEIYRHGERSYSLEDSKYISSTEYTSDSTKQTVKEGVRLKTVTTMVAAPKKWLEEKGYQIKNDD